MAVGGAFGALVRGAAEQGVGTPSGQFPWTTFAINLVGAFFLGVLMEALAGAGDDTGRRRQARLVLGTGFLGAFTTYSTLAVETTLLNRGGHEGVAFAYLAASVLGGLLCVTGGMAGAAGGRGGGQVSR